MILAAFLPATLLVPASAGTATTAANASGIVGAVCLGVNSLSVAVIGYPLTVTTIVQNSALLSSAGAYVVAANLTTPAIAKMLLIKKCLMVAGSVMVSVGVYFNLKNSI